MTLRTSTQVAAALFGLHLLAGPALGQHREYYVRGKVLDTQSKPVPGVQVRLLDVATSRSYTSRRTRKASSSSPFVNIADGVVVEGFAKDAENLKVLTGLRATHPAEAEGDRLAGHHANLYPNPADDKQRSADGAVREFLAAGVPARKLVLGVPFYGRVWAAWVGTPRPAGSTRRPARPPSASRRDTRSSPRSRSTATGSPGTGTRSRRRPGCGAPRPACS
jgi:hypothetical protein